MAQDYEKGELMTFEMVVMGALYFILFLAVCMWIVSIIQLILARRGIRKEWVQRGKNDALRGVDYSYVIYTDWIKASYLEGIHEGAIERYAKEKK